MVFNREQQHMSPEIKGALSHSTANERRKNVTFGVSSAEEKKQREKHASTARQGIAAAKV